MTTKEYLNQIKKLDNLVSARMRQLEKVRQEYTYITGISYDGVHVQSSTMQTGFERSEKIVDKEADIIRLITRLQKTRDTILNQISQLDNPVHVQILIERYVNYRTFDEIADIIHRSYDRTAHLHGDALNAFKMKNDI